MSAVTPIRPAVDYEKTSFDEAVAALLAEMRGDTVAELTQALHARLKADRAFVEAYRVDILYMVASELASRQTRVARIKIAAQASATDPQRSSRLRNFAADYMNWPLPGGKRLGSAKLEEVRQAANYYAAHAREYGWKARWLDRVAGALAARGDAQKPVEAVLTNHDIQKMQEAARGDQ